MPNISEHILGLKNKKFIVTGASRGIGLTITKHLTNLGAKVLMSSSSMSNLKTAQESLEKPGNSYLLECNMKDTDSIENFIKESVDLMSGFDGIVCNAGIIKDRLSLRMRLSEWEEVINVNLKSTFALNKYSFKYLMKNKWGRIINMSSVVAFTGNVGQANYCAAKGGMVSMTKSLALEYVTRNVTVNCIAPGFITTEMTDNISEKQLDYAISRIPMGKQGTVDDIANMTCFLLSEATNYITGQVLHVNGGLYM